MQRVSLTTPEEFRASPARDPHRACSACGTLGTSSRIWRSASGQQPLIAYYCTGCWPSEVARHRAEMEADGERAWVRMFNDDNRPTSFSAGSFEESETWFAVLETIQGLEEFLSRAGAPNPGELLAEMANYIINQPNTLEGPMPDAVANFVRRHGTVA